MFILKLQYGGDLHRINLPDVSVLKGMEDLKVRGISCFPELASSPLRICYVDDEGDSIRITLDEELIEALRYAVDVGNKGMKFTFTDEQKMNEAPYSLPAAHNKLRNSSYFDLAANPILDHEYIVHAHRSLPSVLPLLPGVIPMMSSFFVNLSQMAAQMSPEKSPISSISDAPGLEVQEGLSQLKRSIEQFQNQIRQLNDSGGSYNSNHLHTGHTNTTEPKRIFQKRNSGPIKIPELTITEPQAPPLSRSRRNSMPVCPVCPTSPPIDMPRSTPVLFKSHSTKINEDLFAGSKMGVLLNRLKEAGYDDVTKNILALSTTGGDITEAINELNS